MKNLIELTNRKILITGASSGIGRATAILASELGAELVLCDIDEARLTETMELIKNNKEHIMVPLDIREFERYDELFEKAVSDGVKLDGLVHCAGIAKVVPLRMMSSDKIHDIFDVNYTSFVMLTAMYVKKKYSRGGSVVGISAINAHYPQKCMSIYAGSKAALEASVKTFAIELAERDIRINCIAPGAVDTPMTQAVDEAALTAINQRHLLGMRSPEDIAHAIAFMLSDASAAITGRTLFADGGLLGHQI